jgi:hypothetical protein
MLLTKSNFNYEYGKIKIGPGVRSIGIANFDLMHHKNMKLFLLIQCSLINWYHKSQNSRLRPLLI